MATDLYAEIVQSIATPLEAWLVAQGAEPGLKLAPPTREGAGDLAAACHRYAKALRKPPQAIAVELAGLASTSPWVAAVEPAAGFLNLRLNWERVAERTVKWAQEDEGALGRSAALAGRKVVIEYSSPNTNKPQHLGHCRNNILGHTMATLLEAAGAEVVRVNLINDRGIHICKSMVAYQRFGHGETPQTNGVKGDHLVGAFYVRFDQAFKAEYAESFPQGGGPDPDAWFNGDSPLGRETRDMLRAWEAGDPEVLALWRTMNGWCEQGFFETYARMGVRFDHIDKESETWTLGRDLVTEGLERGVFRRLDDGAVVFDLEQLGLEGQKAVLRGDGTTLYVTQDLGTALRRFEQFAPDQLIYVVGNEQDRHFEVLFGILVALRPELKGRLFHLSYGMVELPDGKMKSRQGNVVDADDLMDELRDGALEVCQKNLPDASAEVLGATAEAIGLAGLKFFLLRYAPATTFVFDKERSIQPEGETGVYAQYAFARAGRVLEKVGDLPDITADWSVLAEEKPRAVLQALLLFPGEIQAAAVEHKPNLATKAIFEVSRSFAGFYNDAAYRVLDAAPARQVALAHLVTAVHRTLGAGMALLGIQPVDAM